MKRRTAPAGYGVQALNSISPESWAVIEKPSGAIATDKSGALLMRLTKADALAIAAAMTAAIQQGIEIVSPFIGG